MSKRQSLYAPILDDKWFWDFDFEKIHWQASYKTVNARLIERGGYRQWEELIRFYREDKVLNALKNAILFLPRLCHQRDL